MAQWYAELEARGSLVGWLSFDDGDRDELGVLGYVVGALETAGCRFSANVRSLIESNGFATSDVLTGGIINELCQLAEPVFLFIDDLHLLRDTALQHVLMSFIERAPAGLHAVVASRELPQFPLARARALGKVVEITARDLRFSAAETAAFMASAGTEALDANELKLLDGRVEGWVAGLKLAAIALENDVVPARLLEMISGRTWTYADFFVEVVIARQSPQLADFLLTTSLLDTFCPELCDAVTESAGARAMIDEIESRGLFIFSLDGERRWYRYHHLFAEFLRAQFATCFAERGRAVHARAGRWLAAAGLPDDAFAHAIKAHDFGLAAEILNERCHNLFYDGQLRFLLDYAAQIPPDVLERYPRVQLAKAWSLVLEWKFAEARAILDSVKRRLGALAGSTSREAMLYLHCTMMLAQFEDDMPAVEHKCAALIERFMDSDPYLVGTYYTSLLYAEREQFKLRNARRLDVLARDYFTRSGSRFVIVWHQSIAGPTKFLAGDTAGAIAALRDGFAAAIGISGRESPLASIPALLLAEIHYERNELEEAHALVSVHLELATGLGFVDQLVAGYLTHSRLERHAGDFAAADRSLERGLELALSRGFHRLVNNIIAEQIAQALRRERIDDALRIGHAFELPAEPDRLLPKSGTTTGTEARAVAWVALAQAQRRLPLALLLAKRWLQFAESAGAVRAEIRWATIVAQILLAGGDARGAERITRRAIAAAAPGRFMRTFLDLGRLLPLLVGEAGAADANPADAFAYELLALVQGYPVAPEEAGSVAPTEIRAPIEQLNVREIEIVKLVAAGMSNREIAERLALSEGTVKWHAHRVFDKLGVQRRTAAVQVARRMGLIA